MKKVRWFLKWVGIPVLIILALELLVWGVNVANKYLREATAQAAEVVTEAVATAGGYARPVPQLSDFTALELVEREALACDINPALARALLIEESSRNQSATSSAGAIGLMQVMPFNAKRCGLTPQELRESTVKNIRCGMAIFCDEMRAHGFDPDRAVQAYNGSAKCIDRCPESIKHARKVLRRMARDVS
jgi:hypothetical protein